MESLGGGRREKGRIVLLEVQVEAEVQFNVFIAIVG